MRLSSRNFFRRLRWPSLFIVSTASIFLAVRPGAQASAPPLDTTEARRGVLVQKTTVAGAVTPVRKSTVSAPYNAYVKKIHVKLGERVTEGQPVVTLASTLQREGNVQEEKPLRAPFDGLVVQVLHAEGEYVETGKETSAIVRIDDMSRLFVYSDVPEGDIGRIRVGMPVDVKVNAVLDRTYHGVIREMALASKEKKDWTRMMNGVEYEVRIEMRDPDARVKSGMSSIVDIITDRKENVVLLPHEYVLKDGDQFFVTLLNGDKKSVDVGAQNDDSIEIRSGVADNVRVRKVDFSSLPAAP